MDKKENIAVEKAFARLGEMEQVSKNFWQYINNVNPIGKKKKHREGYYIGVISTVKALFDLIGRRSGEFGLKIVDERLFKKVAKDTVDVKDTFYFTDDVMERIMGEDKEEKKM